MALLVEHADWPTAVERMRAHNFQGEVVVSQIIEEDMAEVEKLLEDEKKVASVPEEMEVPAPVEEAPESETVAPRVKGLEYIEGVGSAYSQKLHEIGITNVAELLDKGATPQGRKQIADFTGISDKLVLRWVNMADLYRIKGIGQEYAELVEAAGVDTVPELAKRNPANLLEKLSAANAEKKMVRRLPTQAQVDGWVEQAKGLPPVITY